MSSNHLVVLDKEIAVQVARNPSGEIQAFPAVEMEFNDEANLVEYLLCPADISEEIAAEAVRLAKTTVSQLLISVDFYLLSFFLDPDGELLINEVAPRPHNSGHHTIEGNLLLSVSAAFASGTRLAAWSNRYHQAFGYGQSIGCAGPYRAGSLCGL